MNEPKHKANSETGAVTLFLALILIMLSTIFILFAANVSLMSTKSITNILRGQKAFQAAQAGMEFGIAYLAQNRATIIANPVSGYISYGSTDSNLTNIPQGDSSKYSVVYTNPIASNYTTILITSTGVNDDGTATRVIKQTVSMLSNNVNASVTAGGNVSLVGGSVLTNTITNLNIQTGGTLTINNGASTVTSSGTSTTQGNIRADVQQNLSSLKGLTEPNFFQTVVGTAKSTVQAQAQATGTYYNNAVSGGDYSQTLKNKSGVVIYISQANVSLGQGVTIGTSANPVTIIVDGNLTIANGVTLYGYVYSSNSLNLAGGATLTGGMVSYGAMNISNGFRMNFQSISKVAGTAGAFAKVPGSWRDF